MKSDIYRCIFFGNILSQERRPTTSTSTAPLKPVPEIISKKSTQPSSSTKSKAKRAEEDEDEEEEDEEVEEEEDEQPKKKKQKKFTMPHKAITPAPVAAAATAAAAPSKPTPAPKKATSKEKKKKTTKDASAARGGGAKRGTSRVIKPGAKWRPLTADRQSQLMTAFTAAQAYVHIFVAQLLFLNIFSTFPLYFYFSIFSLFFLFFSFRVCVYLHSSRYFYIHFSLPLFCSCIDG